MFNYDIDPIDLDDIDYEDMDDLPILDHVEWSDVIPDNVKRKGVKNFFEEPSYANLSLDIDFNDY